jgi:hypothetical protein
MFKNKKLEDDSSSDNLLKDPAKEPRVVPHKQSIVMTLLINLALIAILLGPWVWASLSSHMENPVRYIQETFRSVYSREKGSWNAMHGHASSSSSEQESER